MPLSVRRPAAPRAPVLGAALGLSLAALLSGCAPTARVETVDFTTARAATTPARDAAAPPPSTARIHVYRIPIEDDSIEIAEGVHYAGWTFGGSVPGPVLRVREGDSVRVTVVNRAMMPHSIDFHSARIPMSRAYRTINPGDSVQFAFRALDAGAYLVHCGTPPVLLHLMQGMYLAILVDPKSGWPTRADKEFVLLQSEFYTHDGEHGPEPDFDAALGRRASHVVFNGRAFQYQQHPLQVEVGDLVRIWVVNAGPTFASDFHIVGAIFDRVYPDGDPDHALRSVQTWSVPAGSGAVFETHFAANESGEGVYAFVTHAFADASKGAVGLIQVGHPAGGTTGTSH
jgi:nitrite reductase (NO-forming)